MKRMNEGGGMNKITIPYSFIFLFLIFLEEISYLDKHFKHSNVKSPSLTSYQMDDSRIVLFSAPPLQEMKTKILLGPHGARFEDGHVSWGSFPDGFPNLFIEHVDQVRERERGREGEKEMGLREKGVEGDGSVIVAYFFSDTREECVCAGVLC